MVAARSNQSSLVEEVLVGMFFVAQKRRKKDRKERNPNPIINFSLELEIENVIE